MSDYVLTDSDELRHYGVIGMKWGVHRAKKKGTKYEYKSHSTKKYERKAAKAWKKHMKYDEDSRYKAKNDNQHAKYEAKAAKYANKYDKMENRRKRSAEHDKRMFKLSQKAELGKEVAKYLLVGGLGATSYMRMKASGKMSKGKAAATTALMYGLVAPVSTPIAGYVSKSNYIRQDERKKR